MILKEKRSTIAKNEILVNIRRYGKKNGEWKVWDVESTVGEKWMKGYGSNHAGRINRRV